MASKASGIKAASSFRSMLVVPEDGFDDGELEEQQNLVLSNTSLKSVSLRKGSQQMKWCRSDSALVLCCSTMSGLRLSETDSDASTCGSTVSTRESSVEDAGMNSKRCVTFGDVHDAEAPRLDGNVMGISSIRTDDSAMRRGMAEIRAHPSFLRSCQGLEALGNAAHRDRAGTDLSTPRMVNISSLATDYSSMYQGRARTDSRYEDMFRVSSAKADRTALAGDQPRKVDSTFGGTMSVTTDYSPRRWRTRTEDDRIDAIISSKKHNSSQAASLTLAGHEEDTRSARTYVNATHPKVSEPSTWPDMEAPYIEESQCIARASAPPQGHVSQAGNCSDCLAHLKIEFQQLQETQRALLEERRRLLAVPSACSNTASRTMPSLWTPPGAWNHSTETMRNRGSTSLRCEALIKPHDRTTIIIQNLPRGFARDSIEELLNSQGFAKRFDFIYAPVRFATMAPVGYAFVNLVSSRAAEECRSKLDGFSDWGKACEDVLSVVWSENDQGLKAIIDRHRNSPVMHPSVPEQFKPAVYKDGAKSEFPFPTKKIKPPKESKKGSKDATDGYEKDS